MDDQAAIEDLVSDLRWQLDQLKPRGIKDAAGKPYSPSYYKRGLTSAIKRGEVVEYVQGYLQKPPSDGYKKLEEADSLDLACESLVMDAEKPYAHMFTDADRAAAHERLAPYLQAVEVRNAEHREHIVALRNERRARQGLPSLTDEQLER